MFFWQMCYAASRFLRWQMAINSLFDVWIFLWQVDNGQIENNMWANFAVIISLDGSLGVNSPGLI